MWALDGLAAAAGLTTQRESLAALVELCAVRRGRLALRSCGMVAELLQGAGG
jgi:hypothetical protein